MYRAVWLFMCAGLAVVGAGVMFAISVPALLALFGGAAVIVGALAMSLTGWDDNNSPRSVMKFVGKASWLGGTATVAIAGLGALFGPSVVLLLVVLVTGTSPTVIQFLHGPGPHAGGSQGWQSIVADPPSSQEVTPLPSHSELAVLSDKDLCLAWRASFSALEKASDSQRMQIIQTRQEYLDEFEPRNPRGLSAWFASGARAAVDPSRFVTGSAGHSHGSINWDELIPGQDR